MSVYSKAISDNAAYIFTLDALPGVMEGTAQGLYTATTNGTGLTLKDYSVTGGTKSVDFTSNTADNLYYSETNDPLVQSNYNLAVEAVFRHTESAGTQYLYYKGNGNGDAVIQLYISNGQVTYQAKKANNSSSPLYATHTHPTTLIVGNWYHVVASWGVESNSVTIYLNNSASSGTGVSGGIDFGDNTNLIGRSHIIGQGFRNELDFVAVYANGYSNAMNSTRVGQHYSDFTAGVTAFADATVSASPKTASALLPMPVIAAQKVVNYSASPMTASATVPDHRVSNFNYTTRLSTYIKDTLNVANYFKFDTKEITNYGTAAQTQWFPIGNYALETDSEVIGPGNEPYGRFDGILTSLNIPRESEPLWSEDIENDDFTLGLWFKYSGASEGSFIQIFDSASVPLLDLGLTSNGYLRGYYKTSTGESTITGTVDLTDDQWHLVALSYKASTSTLKLFHNDGVVGTATLSGNAGAFYNAGLMQFSSGAYNVAISTMFVDSFTNVGETALDNIYALGTQFITGHAQMIMPTTAFSTALYDYIGTLNPSSFVKFDGVGLPIDFGDDSVSWGLNGTAGDIVSAQPAKNIYSYKFVDKESFYETAAYAPFGTNDRISAFALFKVNPSLMNDGGTGAYGSKNIIFSPATAGTGGLVLGVGADNFFAYIANPDYSEETFLESAASTLDSNWHSLAVVKNGTSFKLYLDGKEIDSATLDASIEFTDASGYGFIGGNEVFWFTQDNTPTEKYIDTVASFSTALTAQQIFEMHQLASTVERFEASAMFPVPVGVAGFGPTINPGVMYSTALLVDPTQQDTVAPTILPMTAFITTVTPNFAGTATATISASPMTASALFHMPQYDIGEVNSVDHMNASAVFVNPQVFIPGFYNANPMIATDAQVVMPGFTNTKGAVVKAPALYANAFLVTPPAYYILQDDPYYVRLFNQHSTIVEETPQITTNLPQPTSLPKKSFLKFFNGITSPIAANSNTFISSNLPEYVFQKPNTYTYDNDGNIIVDTSVTQVKATGISTATPKPALTPGFYDDQNRPAVRINNIEFAYPENSYISDRQYSTEFTFKTTKQNQIMFKGEWNSFLYTGRNSSAIGLFNGKLYAMTVIQDYRKADITPHPLDLTSVGSGYLLSKANLADDQWHHVIVQWGFGDDRTQFWIDGKLDRQLIGSNNTDGSNGGAKVRPFIMGNSSTNALYQSDFQISVWSYDPASFISLDSTGLNYIAYSKSTPIVAEAMTASIAVTQDTKAKGNRTRALMLYWWPEEGSLGVTPNTQTFNVGLNGMPTALGFNTDDFIGDGPQKWLEWDIFPVDINGFYISDVIKPSAIGGEQNIRVREKTYAVTGAQQGSFPKYKTNLRDYFRDEKDDRRYIDVLNDIDLSQFDVIFFKNYPDQSSEQDQYIKNEIVDQYFGLIEKQLYETFLVGLRNAVNSGISLLVTNPQLAIDLKIVDRVEEISQQEQTQNDPDVELYEQSIMPTENGVPRPSLDDEGYFPDSHYMTNFRLINSIAGMTDYPVGIRTDRSFWENDGLRDFTGTSKNFERVEWKPTGIQVNNEFDALVNPANTLIVGTPFENVKTGKIVTAWQNQVRRGQTLVDNPYANYATTIICQPGDVLDGTQLGGKIFVDLMHPDFKDAYDYAAVDLNTDFWINIAYNMGAITEEEKTTFLASGANLDNIYTSQSNADYLRRSYWTRNDNYLQLGGDQVTLTKALALDQVSVSGKKRASNNKKNYNNKVIDASLGQFTGGGQLWFSIKYAYLMQNFALWTPTISSLGILWLSERVDTIQQQTNHTAKTAQASMVNPVVTAYKFTSKTVEAMLASATITNAVGKAPASTSFAPLPMLANALINELGKNVNAQPFVASALFAPNYAVITSSIDEIIMYLEHVDPILYLREDIIK
jgi:hypothetical protein